MSEERKYRFETLQLHVGQEEADPATDARAVPIYQTTSYVFRNSQHAADRFGLADAGNIYGRLTNSTQGVFEDRIAALEGGVAGLAVASGAAAITYTIQALAKAGDHILAQKTIYGGSYNLLAHTLKLYGIETTFVDVHNLAEVEGAIQDNTTAIFIETLGNPNSDIPDIDAIAEIAHKHGLPLAIDNTFGTETLSLRIERHVENTKKVVEYLSKHPQVEHVNHPSLPDHPQHDLYEKYFPNGGGSIFTFEIKGGQQEAHEFIDNLEIFSLLANVADVKSLVIHPATTTHSQLSPEELADQGIKPNTIRLSIGTEHIDDIIADLDQAFAKVK